MKNCNLKLVFAGTPDCCIPALQTVAEHFNLCALLTNPPARAGRSKTLQPSAAAEFIKCLQAQNKLPAQFPIFTPEKLDRTFKEALKALNPDLLVCFAYGRIFDSETLSLFTHGGINIHPSLLPQWRGASPVQAAIAAGCGETGVTIQKIANKTDTGDILTFKKMQVLPCDTAGTLLTRCSNESAQLLFSILQDFDYYVKQAVPQNENEASYCSVLTKNDGLIDWKKSAEQIEREIRAFSPWPGSFTFLKGQKLNIIKASVYKKEGKEVQSGKVLGSEAQSGILIQTGEGILSVQYLQRQNKKPLFWKDFLNGAHGFLNEVLGYTEY